MRGSLLALSIGIAFASCSSCSGRQSDADSQYNDVATGVRLMDEHPLGQGTAQERVTAMAECSATLLTAARETPPPVSEAERLRDLAARLQKLAVQLGGKNGRTEAQVEAIRDQAIAANEHLHLRNDALFRKMIGPATEACYMGGVMTDKELTENAAVTTGSVDLISNDLLNAASK